MKELLNRISKSFLLNEAMKFDTMASIQALQDVFENIRPTNKRDRNRISLAKEHLRGIKRHLRSLNERIGSLEEELNLLKEEK